MFQGGSVKADPPFLLLLNFRFIDFQHISFTKYFYFMYHEQKESRKKNCFFLIQLEKLTFL